MSDSDNRRGEGAFEEAKASRPDDFLSGAFYFDPADPIYADHFPGCPVVPGSLIVQAFLKALRNSGMGIRPGRIQDFKFRKFIAPGEYEFLLEKRGDSLRCRLLQPGTDGRCFLATGTIIPHPADDVR